jgi:hypothetical protein
MLNKNNKENQVALNTCSNDLLNLSNSNVQLLNSNNQLRDELAKLNSQIFSLNNQINQLKNENNQLKIDLEKTKNELKFINFSMFESGFIIEDKKLSIILNETLKSGGPQCMNSFICANFDGYGMYINVDVKNSRFDLINGFGINLTQFDLKKNLSNNIKIDYVKKNINNKDYAVLELSGHNNITTLENIVTNVIKSSIDLSHNKATRFINNVIKFLS